MQSEHRLLKERHVVIASGNQHKQEEITNILHPYGYVCYSAESCGATPAEETGKTFQENAILKARQAALFCEAPAIADDSGLCIDDIQGAPGIYSSRWAGQNADYTLAFNAIKELLGSARVADKAEPIFASFYCVIAVAWPDNHIQCYQGQVKGSIIFPPRGNQGFGYDPIFSPQGSNLTYAEMTFAEKMKTSHRRLALEKFIEDCAIKPQ